MAEKWYSSTDGSFRSHLVLFGDWTLLTTVANDKRPMTSYLRLVVTVAVPCLVFEILMMWIFHTEGRFGHFWSGGHWVMLTGSFDWGGWVSNYQKSSIVTVAVKCTVIKLGPCDKQTDGW